MVHVQLAIVRFVPRDTSQPTVFAGSPLPPAPDRPGCLLLNKLPFQVPRPTRTLLMYQLARGTQGCLWCPMMPPQPDDDACTKPNFVSDFSEKHSCKA